MGYGQSVTSTTPFGVTYGSTFGRGGTGQLRIRNLFDQTVVTPAERIAQFAVLGAAGGFALSALVMLGTDAVPKKRRWSTLGLLSIPAAATIGAVLVAGSEYQA